MADEKSSGSEKRWEHYKAYFVLALLAVWVVAFGIGLADMVFDLGWFPTRLERMLRQDIRKLQDADPNVRSAAEKELIDYNQFSVPVLLRMMQRGDKATRLNCARCLAKIAERYFGQKIDFGEDIEKWKKWWRQNKV